VAHDEHLFGSKATVEEDTGCGEEWHARCAKELVSVPGLPLLVLLAGLEGQADDIDDDHGVLLHVIEVAWLVVVGRGV